MNLAEIMKKSSRDVTICKPDTIEEDEDIHAPFIWTTPVPKTRTTIRITTSKYSRVETVEKVEVEAADMTLHPKEHTKAVPCTGKGGSFFNSIIHF